MCFITISCTSLNPIRFNPWMYKVKQGSTLPLSRVSLPYFYKATPLIPTISPMISFWNHCQWRKQPQIQVQNILSKRSMSEQWISYVNSKSTSFQSWNSLFILFLITNFVQHHCLVWLMRNSNLMSKLLKCSRSMISKPRIKLVSTVI